MENIGYVLLSIVVLLWLIAIGVGLVAAFPVGLIALLPICGLGFLFAQVVKERLANKEDDYYTKNVEK